MTEDEEYLVFNDLQHFAYGIADRYYTDRTNNDIILEIWVDKRTVVTAKTNFFFSKQGESGTNGTGIVCKIIGVRDGKRVSGWLTNTIRKKLENDNNVCLYNWDSLQVELWQNGERIFSKNTSDTTLGITVQWEMLSLEDVSWYSIDKDSGVLSLNPDLTIRSNYFTQFNNTRGWPANIVKVTVDYNGRRYYDCAPIVTIYTYTNSSSSTTYKEMQIDPYSGFKYVTYSQDGQNPMYDDTIPFLLLQIIINLQHIGKRSVQLVLGWILMKRCRKRI